ncbi:uncharacterized protein PGTG_02384 [Puccinia graminis f. sp. tritici CRL 75-36-700-3]|uniref:Uncharacterized protein n=1 Tax=Puccinia graminis f. sp. tritici (strain CRL 75-36-700-3 / race SCCL) TaxID=418459 RepID=E3JXZ8_PUCGT|nr:uncharacterized protein PGTG_02384 [Puccinia graminis f. sp. tritici CRL 75-36-700-3]EFP76923.2 hypothetical protein PGTG_02384 [Puccinia graminis f. sp. tritici CRL 75-36-700-3]
MIDPEFELLASLTQACDQGLDAGQTAQVKLICISTVVGVPVNERVLDRLVQALKTLKSKGRKKNRALVRSITSLKNNDFKIEWEVRSSVCWILRMKQLPLLHHHVHELLKCLNPVSLHLDSNRRFREGLEILSEIDNCMDQISVSVASIWDSPSPADSQVNVETLTPFRRHRLVHSSQGILGIVSDVLGRFEGFISHFFVSDNPKLQTSSTNDSLVHLAVLDLGVVNFLIESLGQSDFVVFLREWSFRERLRNLDCPLTSLIILGNSSQIKRNPEKSLVRKQIEGLVTLYKLHRVLVLKICKFPHIKPGLIPETNFRELEALPVATSTLEYELEQIVQNLRLDHTRRPDFVKLTLAIDDLETAFKKIKDLLNQIFASPNHNFDREAYQYSQQWIQLWISQFNLAANNFFWISNAYITEKLTSIYY